MSRRVLNFGAGPAMLPDEVMSVAQSELLDWQGTGKSVMEIGHRTPDFISIAAEAEQTLRELMSVPDNYHVLFLAGGATLQYSVVPMNLLRGKTTADYLNTGIWSAKAMRIGSDYTAVNEVCSSAEAGYANIPETDQWQLNPGAAYCLYTENETIGGVEFHFIPEVEPPLVCDMTSSFLSRPIDVSRYGLIFAGAQKNVGPAGLTLVIVDSALCGDVLPGTPDLLNYQLQADSDSMLNTPPTFNWYMAGLMFNWIKQQGGLEEIEQRNQRKADILYQLIDESDFYRNHVHKNCRSRMNVIFHIEDVDLTSRFIQEAESHHLHALKGHRLAGGLRASLYNAVPESGVKQLAEFMREFERTFG